MQIWVGAAEVSGGGYWRAGVFGTDSNGEIDNVFGRSAVKNLHGSDIFNFIFDDVVIPASEGRIAILGCRIDSDGESGSDSRSAHLREGSESAQSPDFSYDDAPDDFDRVHHSRYEHAHPEVGDGRHDHGESTIRGDIKIFYTITYDHGNLVGDGNVGVGHIDSGSADDGDVLTADGSGGAAFEAPTGGGGGGTPIAVDGVAAFYTVATRILAVQVQQDNGVDFTGTATFPIASTARYGMIETATDAEATAGTASDKALVPANLLSIFGSVVSDTDIDVASPSSESTAVAPSRQAVAEAISANSGGGGSDDGVVDGVTLGYTDATRVVDLTVERTVGADLTASATIAFASTSVAGLIQTAVEAEVAAETAGVALTPANLPDVDVDQLSSGTTPTGHLPYAASGGGVTWGAAPSGAGTELTQAMVEDETDTTFGLVSGERLSQAVAVFATGGSGGGSTDRIALASTVGVSNTAGPHEIALTEAMVAGQLLTFFMFTTATASPDGIGYLLSDDILALTAEATAPTDAENALPVVTASYSASNFSQQSGNYFVYRKDDSTLWVRPTRLAAHTLTITATPLGGGGTAGQQAGGITVVENQVITAIFPMTEAPLADDWRGTQQQGIPLTAIPKDEIDRIEFGIRIDSRYVIPFVVTRGMLNRLAPTSDIIPTSPANSAVMQGVYWSGRPSAPNASREHLILLPTYGYMDGRRLANRSGFFMTFDDDASGDNWVQAYVGANSGDEIDISYLTTYRFQTD